jgi:hypothetical protein
MIQRTHSGPTRKWMSQSAKANGSWESATKYPKGRGIHPRLGVVLGHLDQPERGPHESLAGWPAGDVYGSHRASNKLRPMGKRVVDVDEKALAAARAELRHRGCANSRGGAKATQCADDRRKGIQL